MGGEPWLIRKPFFESPEYVLKKHRAEILNETPDWPEIVITDGSPVKFPGWGQPTMACTICPMPDDLLQKTFGTDRPLASISDEDLETALEDCDIDRGEGYFVILYQDEFPKEICFYGCSFD